MRGDAYVWSGPQRTAYAFEEFVAVTVTGAIIETLTEAAVNAMVFRFTLALELFIANAMSTALRRAQALVTRRTGVFGITNALL